MQPNVVFTQRGQFIQEAFNGETEAKFKVLESYEKNVFTPEFIKFDIRIKVNYKLSYLETLLYGFVQYYLSSDPNKRFYFTDKQLSETFHISEKTAGEAVNNLVKAGLISSKRELKTWDGGGQIRYIQMEGLPTKSRIGYPQKVGGNKKYRNKNYTSIVEANKKPLAKPDTEVHNTVQDSPIRVVRSTTQVKDKRKRAMEVTKLIQACQIKLNIPKLDGTQKETRNFASMLLSDLEKAKVPLPRFLEALSRIKHIQTAPYLRTSITSMYKIRQNLSKILKYGEDFSQQGWEVGVEYYQDGKILMCSPTGKLEVIEDIYKIKERKEPANEDL